jgi:hypothetical protein
MQPLDMEDNEDDFEDLAPLSIGRSYSVPTKAQNN